MQTHRTKIKQELLIIFTRQNRAEQCYFSFISDSLKQKLFVKQFFFQILSYYPTDWLILEGLSAKVNLNQISKTFWIGIRSHSTVKSSRYDNDRSIFKWC
jgi:hypothetical protein